MKIGIIGNGFVGKATNLLKSNTCDTIIYDIKPEFCQPPNTTLSDLEICDLIFLCLPTPLNFNGEFYTNIVSETILKIKNPFKIIKSTTSIGFSDKYNCFFMPEFLSFKVQFYLCPRQDSNLQYGVRSVA